MPIVDDDQLRILLAEGRIAAITVDTGTFDEKQLQLHSATLQALARLNGRGFLFVLANTVQNEVIRHLEDTASQSFRSARKGIGQALHAFGTKDPTREKLLNQITGGRTPTEVAHEYFGQYMSDSGSELLDDAGLVDTGTLFDDYFAGRAPFGAGKKKSEFPDALALNALERTAISRGIGILVVSKDRDWKEFCQDSDHLYHITDLDRALALVANAPPVLRNSILDWLEDDARGGADLQSEVARKLLDTEFTADGYASFGECELYVWAAELKSIIWPGEDKIDIIEFEPQEGADRLPLVLSLPLLLVANIPVEVSFSIWDGIDKESVPMGGRMIEFDDEIDAHATITLDICNPGTADEEIFFLDVEIDASDYEIDLGRIDVFEPEDFEFDDEEPLDE